LRPFEPSPSGAPNPTYRCLVPEAPAPGTVQTCEEAGVLGPLAGLVGSIMAHEVVREIVGFGEGLVGRLLLIDARDLRFETIQYEWDDTNPLNGTKAKLKAAGVDLAL
jgi:molybdopterin-synthase adenylyltransferase